MFGEFIKEKRIAKGLSSWHHTRRYSSKVAKTLEENNLLTFLKKDPDAVLSRTSPTPCKPLEFQRR